MFKKILVAIDHSKLGQCVFSEALDLAKSLSASLLLLNVLSPEDESSPSTAMLNQSAFYTGEAGKGMVEIYEELWQSYAEQELAMLRSLANQATAIGLDVTVYQKFGDPSRIICDLARELNVDLIMLGRRGRSGLNELILGSVSNYTLHHAPCSVLTIHRHRQTAVEPLENQPVIAV